MMPRKEYEAALTQVRAYAHGMAFEGSVVAEGDYHPSARENWAPYRYLTLKREVPLVDGPSTAYRMASLAITIGGALSMYVYATESKGTTCSFSVAVSRLLDDQDAPAVLDSEVIR